MDQGSLRIKRHCEAAKGRPKARRSNLNSGQRLLRRANRAVPNRPFGTAAPSGRPPLGQAVPSDRAPDWRLAKRRPCLEFRLAMTLQALSSNTLDQIQIVLVEPQHAGNIGSVARAMKNMGLSRLVLVRPPDEWFESAKIMAANSVDILKRAYVADSLSQGIADSIHVVGTTRRGGETRSPVTLNKTSSKRILKKAEKGTVSILFGNERVGLSDDELSNCQENIFIPTSPNQPSLNLSHSVLLVAYELFCNSFSSKFSVIQKNKEKYLAREKDLDEMCRLIEPALVKLGYSNARKRSHLGLLLKTIKKTAKRSEFEIRDVRMIEGIARRIMDRLTD